MNNVSDTSDLWLSGGVAVFSLIWALLVLVAGWKMYVKAGQHGWTAIIPIINMIALLKIVHRPVWWLLLFLIPFVNIVVMVIVLSDLSRAFGHGLGMTFLLILLTPIAYLVLGYGESTYRLTPDQLF